MAHDGCDGPGVKRSIAGAALYVLVTVPGTDMKQWEMVPGTFRLDPHETMAAAQRFASFRDDCYIRIDHAAEPLH